MTILFLDFDGVLHSNGKYDDGYFCRLPVLWEILRTRPEVEVVFSTSWREIYRLEEMLDFVTANGGEDLRHRFIGQTPSIPVAPDADEYRSREIECLAWLSENNRDLSRWLALDDFEYWFSRESPNLYLVNNMTGLTEMDIPAILERLNA